MPLSSPYSATRRGKERDEMPGQYSITIVVEIPSTNWADADYITSSMGLKNDIRALVEGANVKVLAIKGEHGKYV